MGGLFPHIDTDQRRELFFALTYKQHGGSGLNFTMADVLDMDLADLLWNNDRLRKQRRDEAKEVRRASSKK